MGLFKFVPHLWISTTVSLKIPWDCWNHFSPYWWVTLDGAMKPSGSHLARWPRLTRIKLDECLTSLAILGSLGGQILMAKNLGIPRYRPATEGKNAVETVVTSTFYTALSTFHWFTPQPWSRHSPQCCSSLTPWKPWTGNPNICWVYQFSYWKFTAMCWNLLSCIRWVFSQFSFNFHMIRVDVYSICRFNMIEHDLTAHSKTPVQHKGLPFPGHVAPMDACVLGQCRSATGGDLDWAMDQ